LISAVADGVVIAGTTDNVDNTGTIQGGNSGVWLEAGGTVANSGSIAGTGTSSYGVRLTAGGSVTNGSPGELDASITGAEGVGTDGRPDHEAEARQTPNVWPCQARSPPRPAHCPSVNAELHRK
jgi:hypothetical protein